VAGEWIKVERSTPDKPEVLRIARELVIDRDAVFGKLMLVWMWFDANSVDGVVDGAVDADVDAVTRHLGFASVMRSVNWLKDAPSGKGLLLPNFARHNGETAKKRAQSNRRQSRWRNAHVDDAASTTASTREEKRRTNTNKAFDAAAIALPEWLDKGLWAKWVADRKDRRKPVTLRGAAAQIAKLREYRVQGFTPEEVIDHSIANGYQGLFPPSKPKQQEPPLYRREGVM